MPIPETNLAAKDAARAIFREAIPTLSTLNFDIYKHKRGYMAYVRLPTSTALSSLAVRAEAFVSFLCKLRLCQICAAQIGRSCSLCDMRSTCKLGRRLFLKIICTCHRHQRRSVLSIDLLIMLKLCLDPVTGTAHACLAAFYADKKGHKSNDPIQLVGFQASKRTGVVTCIVKGDRVGICISCDSI